MKYLLFSLLTIFTLTQTAFAQDEDIAVNLDNALAMSEKGDMPALEMAMTKVQTQVEKQAGEGNSDFKDKLLTTTGSFKNMLPMLSKGAAKTADLQKIISTIKLLLGAHKLSNMLGGGGSLLTQAAGLKSSLGLMKMGMSVLGGKGDQMGSLLGTAMSSVTQLEKGGMGTKTAEPALKKQLGSILDLAKGAL
jgi:hypothetical protein